MTAQVATCVAVVAVVLVVVVVAVVDTIVNTSYNEQQVGETPRDWGVDRVQCLPLGGQINFPLS